MTNNEERRYVAARLRAIEFDLDMESDLEIELERFYNALECNIGQRNQKLHPYKYLADLIDPEERTCTIERFTEDCIMFGKPAKRTVSRCSACKQRSINGNYCKNCGAKVVE